MRRPLLTLFAALLVLPAWTGEQEEPPAEEALSEPGVPAPRGCTDGGELKDGVCSKGQPVYLVDGKSIAFVKPPERVPTKWPEGTDKSIRASLNLQIIVLPDGTVTEIRPMFLRVTLPGEGEQRMNPEEDEYGFVKSASDAVSRWRYTPPTLNGEPVAVYGSVCVNFSKDGSDDNDEGSNN
ncbi:MAG: energy transducer TonB [Planctomycetota bacterium]|jgi:hypothetical protein